MLLCRTHECKQKSPKQGGMITTFSECEWSDSKRCLLTSASSICRTDLSYNEHRKLLCNSRGALLPSLSPES